MSVLAGEINSEAKSSEQEFTAGVFLVDKPIGPTSFRIVQQFRRALGMKKIGHAGTLDPFASGLLVVCAGRPATKIIDQLMIGEKEYEATLKLGIATDTQDIEGEIIASLPVPDLDMAQVADVMAGFGGDQLQVPPKFSALKHKGKPLYYYARRGVEVVKDARPIFIRHIECLSLDGDLLRMRVVCSKGTYIRTLAADIADKLGCGGHLIQLRRTRSGVFSVDNALSTEELTKGAVARDYLLGQAMGVDETLALL